LAPLKVTTHLADYSWQLVVILVVFYISFVQQLSCQPVELVVNLIDLSRHVVIYQVDNLLVTQKSCEL